MTGSDHDILLDNDHDPWNSERQEVTMTFLLDNDHDPWSSE